MSAIQIIKERADHYISALESAKTHGGRMCHLGAADAYRETLSLLSLYGDKEAAEASAEISERWANSSFHQLPVSSLPSPVLNP